MVTSSVENLEMSGIFTRHGNVSDFSKNQGIIREKILSGKIAQKYSLKLH